MPALGPLALRTYHCCTAVNSADVGVQNYEALASRMQVSRDTMLQVYVAPSMHAPATQLALRLHASLEHTQSPGEQQQCTVRQRPEMHNHTSQAQQQQLSQLHPKMHMPASESVSYAPSARETCVQAAVPYGRALSARRYEHMAAIKGYLACACEGDAAPAAAHVVSACKELCDAPQHGNASESEVVWILLCILL